MGKVIDEHAVDAVAAKMKARLAEGRDCGRNGWENPDECDASTLSEMFYASLKKQRLISAMNFLMMLWNREEHVVLQEEQLVSYDPQIKAIVEAFNASTIEGTVFAMQARITELNKKLLNTTRDSTALTIPYAGRPVDQPLMTFYNVRNIPELLEAMQKEIITLQQAQKSESGLRPIPPDMEKVYGLPLSHG